MKVIVVFDYPEIKDVNGLLADEQIDTLTLDLNNLAKDVGYNWYIDDVVG
jgi:hypothetical protein